MKSKIPISKILDFVICHSRNRHFLKHHLLLYRHRSLLHEFQERQECYHHFRTASCAVQERAKPHASLQREQLFNPADSIAQRQRPRNHRLGARA